MGIRFKHRGLFDVAEVQYLGNADLSGTYNGENLYILDESRTYTEFKAGIATELEDEINQDPETGNLRIAVRLEINIDGIWQSKGDWYTGASVDQYGATTGTNVGGIITEYLIGLVDPTNLSGYALETVSGDAHEDEDRTDGGNLGAYFTPYQLTNSGDDSRAIEIDLSINQDSLNKAYEYRIITRSVVFYASGYGSNPNVGDHMFYDNTEISYFRFDSFDPSTTESGGGGGGGDYDFCPFVYC